MKSNILLDLDEINSHHKIVVRATSPQLAAVKQILSSVKDESIVKISDNLYELSLKRIYSQVPKLFDAISLNDMLSNETITEQAVDFENSADFYKQAKVKKQFKIIDDEFSYIRNLRLYKGFNLIEAMMRRLISEKKLSADLPQNYQSKSADHVISQYSLGEIIEYHLLQPASEDFILKKWNNSSKTNKDLLTTMKLLRIDELDIPLTSDELNYIRNARNKCMHFRVITIAEYARAVKNLNKYIKVHSIKEFSSIIKGINTKVITNITKSVNGLTNPLSSLINEED